MHVSHKDVAPLRPVSHEGRRWYFGASLIALASCAQIIGVDDDFTPIEPSAQGGRGAAGGSDGGAGGAGGAGGVGSVGGQAQGGAGGLPGDINGTKCQSRSTCASGFCVDGVCCDTRCNSECEACSASKNEATSGVCSFIPNGSDPDSECPGANDCNGKGSC